MTDNTKPANASSPAAAPAANPQGRKKGLTAVAAAVVVAAIAWGGYHWMVSSNYQTTDNAYVGGNVVQITPQVGGTVTTIGADDTDFVKPGLLLVQLDTADALVALSQAESQLAQIVRQTRTLYANNAPLMAQVAAKEADLSRLKAEASRTADDVARRRPLTLTGAVGQEEFHHAQAQAKSAQDAVVAAQAAVTAARAQLDAAEATTKGSNSSDYPAVLAASAKVREAYLALERTRLISPVQGFVAKRGVQLGQRVAAGSPLMTVVDLNNLWVDANFKESQLADLRIGQKTELVADVYGDKVTYHGTIVGLGAGTGAAFSLLPAQNATGNWIKVVQRVPVRISLAPEDLKDHPLRVGLSMLVKVDVRDKNGASLAADPRKTPVAQTSVYGNAMPEAEARIAQIIAGKSLAPLSGLPALTPTIDAAPVASDKLAQASAAAGNTVAK